MIQHRIIATAFNILFLSLTGMCQQYKTDSLRLVFERETNFNEKIKKGIVYATELSLTDTKAAAIVMEQLKENCKQKEMYSQYGDVCAELAGLYYSKGDYIASIIQGELSIKTFTSLQENKTDNASKAYAAMWTGLSYSLINDWENAQQYLQSSITFSEKATDSCRTANSTMNLAYIYYDMQDWQHMQEVLLNSQKFLYGCNNNDIHITTYGSIVIAFARQKKKSAAEKYISKLEEVNKKNTQPAILLFYNAAKGEYAIVNNKPQEAVNMYTAAYNNAVTAGDPYIISFTAEGLGRAYFTAGNTAMAEKYLQEGLSTAQKNNYLSQQQVALRSLSDLYASTGNYQKAWQSSNTLTQLKDSLVIKINANRRLLLDARFETSKKENLIGQLEADKKIQELTIKQKDTLNYILIGSAVTLLAISLLSYRNYKQKQKIQQQRISELETEKKLTATEAVLKGEEQERTRLAKDLHDGLGGMLSGIKYSLNNMKGNLILTPENALSFERSVDMLNSSIQEMRRVAHNLMPEALVKFGLDAALRDFCTDINNSGALQVTYQAIGFNNTHVPQTTAITIYRIVQELLNNTIKHAGASHAIVQLSKTDNTISLTVEDDGIGFDVSVMKSAKGIGWTNIQNRIDFLKGKLDVNSQMGKGTSVLIELVV
jgi:two-component system, NarL family, sensor kinase